MPEKLLVVLDLDGTIVPDTENIWNNKGLLVRPYFFDFYRYCRQTNIQLAVWSSAGSVRVNLICKTLFDSNNLLFVWSHKKSVRRLDSEDGIVYYSKPLWKVWKSSIGKRHQWNRNNTLIVDNTKKCYEDNYGNAIAITTWINNNFDWDFMNIIRVLSACQKSVDVRKVNKSVIGKPKPLPLPFDFAKQRLHSHLNCLLASTRSKL